MKINLLILLIHVSQILLVSSCSNNVKCDMKLNGAQEFDVRIKPSKEGTVINSQEEYFNQIQSSDTPYINFDIHTLIGIYTSSGGCEACFESKFHIKSDQKKYVYEVKKKNKGRCKMLTVSNNWILVDKLPIDYTIEFISK